MKHDKSAKGHGKASRGKAMQGRAEGRGKARQSKTSRGKGERQMKQDKSARFGKATKHTCKSDIRMQNL